jgi:hypothetical protein
MKEEKRKAFPWNRRAAEAGAGAGAGSLVPFIKQEPEEQDWRKIKTWQKAAESTLVRKEEAGEEGEEEEEENAGEAHDQDEENEGEEEWEQTLGAGAGAEAGAASSSNDDHANPAPRDGPSTSTGWPHGEQDFYGEHDRHPTGAFGALPGSAAQHDQVQPWVEPGWYQEAEAEMSISAGTQTQGQGEEGEEGAEENEGEAHDQDEENGGEEEWEEDWEEDWDWGPAEAWPAPAWAAAVGPAAPAPAAAVAHPGPAYPGAPAGVNPNWNGPNHVFCCFYRRFGSCKHIACSFRHDPFGLCCNRVHNRGWCRHFDLNHHI